MKRYVKVLITVIALSTISFGAGGPFPGESLAQEQVINLYGSGGPLAPMKECAEAFSKKGDVTVNVIAGPTRNWIDLAKQDADIIFGGAEYQLTDFTQQYPGILDESTRTSLYTRTAGILVRKGNPRKIMTLSDLTRDGIKLIDVNGAGQVGLWEDLAGVRGLIPGIRRNIALSVTTSAAAIDVWKTAPELDAWITFESWYYRLRDVADLVRLPKEERLSRGTPIAVTKMSKQKDLAREFIQFLQSEEAHGIFRKWGWE